MITSNQIEFSYNKYNNLKKDTHLMVVASKVIEDLIKNCNSKEDLYYNIYDIWHHCRRMRFAENNKKIIDDLDFGNPFKNAKFKKFFKTVRVFKNILKRVLNNFKKN